MSESSQTNGTSPSIEDFVTQGSASSASCSFCHNHHDYLRPVSSWSSAEACEFASNKGIATQDLVCRPCRQDVGRVLGDPSYCPQQKLYVAGAFADENLSESAWYVTGTNPEEAEITTPLRSPEPLFSSNAEETDTRIWLHARKTSCTRVLILSPDTDVYFIGLPLPWIMEKDILVRINKLTAKDTRLLHLTSLLDGLQSDPHFTSVSSVLVAKIIQVFYVATGSDYTSFFSGIGKVTFLRTLLQHTRFITGSQPYTQGSLSDTSLNNDDHQTGFLAFLRLIGSVYFKKNLSGFESTSPEVHFKQFCTPDSKTPTEIHVKWLQSIRESIWDRTAYENEMLPSTEALWRHWKRSCWIVDMWEQADQNTLIDWDSDANVANIKRRVALLTQGCKCKTGCSTLRCGCRKKQEKCSEGCTCQHCTNLPCPPLKISKSEAVPNLLSLDSDGESRHSHYYVA